MSYSFPFSRIHIPVAESALGSANTLVTWKPDRAITITRVAFFVTTEIANDTIAAVLSLTYSTEMDTITIPDATAVGTEVAGAGTSLPVDIAAGGSVVLAVKTAGTDGSSQAGAGYWVIYYQEIPS